MLKRMIILCAVTNVWRVRQGLPKLTQYEFVTILANQPNPLREVAQNLL